MAAQPEARIVKKCLKFLQEFGGWWAKIHGGMYQSAGIPDIIGCIYGQTFGVEVKTPEKYRRSQHNLSARQQATIRDLVRAGAKVKVVCSVEQLENWFLDLMAGVKIEYKQMVQEVRYDSEKAERDIRRLWPVRPEPCNPPSPKKRDSGLPGRGREANS